jgi:hypothetical protein
MPGRREGSDKINKEGIKLARGREEAGVEIAVLKLFPVFLHQASVTNLRIYEDLLSNYSR